MTLSTTAHHPEILLSPEAEQDLRDIYAYMAAQAGQKRADDILDKLETAILLLETLPLRGNIPWNWRWWASPATGNLSLIHI